jgi:hypothetical protein
VHLGLPPPTPGLLSLGATATSTKGLWPPEIVLKSHWLSLMQIRVVCAVTLYTSMGKIILLFGMIDFAFSGTVRCTVVRAWKRCSKEEIEDETQEAHPRNARCRSRCADGSAGPIANTSGVMVGAKEVTPRPDDMFDGSMDFVSIDIASSDVAQ